MKKIFKRNQILPAVIVLLLIAGLAACKKNFLSTSPQGLVTQDAISKDPTAAQQLVDGVYNVMWLGGFGPDIHGLQYIVLTNIASDDGDKGSTPSDYGDAAQVDALNVPASNANINNIWQGYYQGISRANQALSQLQNAQFDAATKNRLIGEVRFLRGYFYFNMVRFFGGVPLLDKVPAASDANNPQYQTRATAQQIYNFIISDLQFADDNLPTKDKTQVGRATKGAAQGLLAKVFLYQKNYQRAYALADSVITGKSGAYSLYPTYEDIWREKGENSSESLFEVQTGTSNACNTAIQIYSDSQGPRSSQNAAQGAWPTGDLGFGFNNPSQSLVNEYEAGDKRKAGTIIFINPTNPTILWDGFKVPSQQSVENSRYNYKAYHSRTGLEKSCGNNDFLPKNLRVLRLADVMLIHAEAAFQTGNIGAATTDLTQIRARAGLTAPSVVNLQTIWHERRVELAMEHDRFFDLVRQDAVQPGRAASAFAADGKTWAAKDALFPIPQPQIDLSGGKLSQNPGY
ncbi:RagB/SusD family nutrient uptake outer membrane protein [Mucilaginibacter sp. NFX135]|uniref:RagB/SusD family nutrient uptake outer membrane protein n=1 Tax=Mucilaginibacter sp. NFX135 TaxID=3402687 RepID=UPI003AFAEF10